MQIMQHKVIYFKDLYSLLWVLMAVMVFISCENNATKKDDPLIKTEVIIKPNMEYGYDLNRYDVKKLKIKRGRYLWRDFRTKWN